MRTLAPWQVSTTSNYIAKLFNSKSPYKFGQYLYVTGGDGEPCGLKIPQYMCSRITPYIVVLLFFGTSMVCREPYGITDSQIARDFEAVNQDLQRRHFDAAAVALD